MNSIIIRMPALFSSPDNQCPDLQHGNNGTILCPGTTYNPIPCCSYNPLALGCPHTRKISPGTGKHAPNPFFYFIILMANGGSSHLSDIILPLLAIHAILAQHQYLLEWLQQLQYYFQIKSTCHYHCPPVHPFLNLALLCFP